MSDSLDRALFLGVVFLAIATAYALAEHSPAAPVMFGLTALIALAWIRRT